MTWARILTSAGLVFGVAGAICLGYLVPRGSAVKIQSVPGPLAPKTTTARWAGPAGWGMLGLGFLLQLVGLWI